MSSATKKTSWKIFYDLQCPYSKKNWDRLPEIRNRLESKYDITVHYTSLAFHPQAFTAQCAANLIGGTAGEEARQRFTEMCFRKQETFMNAALGDCRKSEIDACFADLAQEAACFDGDSSSSSLSREDFSAKLHDWDAAVFPAWKEHKVALAHGAFSTPSHVIDGKLVEGTESVWGPDEWEAKLASL